VFDGKEIRRKMGARASETWVWDGKELRRKMGARASDTWIVERNQVRPKMGANSKNTYDCGSESILVIAGKTALRLFGDARSAINEGEIMKKAVEVMDSEASQPVPANVPAPRYKTGDQVRICLKSFNPPDVFSVVGIHSWSEGGWWYRIEENCSGNPQALNQPEDGLEPADC
jgi:hypothetical protein